MDYKTLLYLGAIGATLAVIGALGSQGAASSFSTGNLSAAFVPGGDTQEMADSLEEALPEIRDNVRRATPYALMQFAGYLLFSLGFVALWQMTKRGIGLAAFLCFALFAVVTLATFLLLPGAMEDLVQVLRDMEGEEAPTVVPAALLLLGGAGLMSLMVQIGGSIAGGYEIYRIAKELDNDFLRGSGALLMAGAIAVFVPVYGPFILLIGVILAGAGFYVLATRIHAALGGAG